MDYLKNHVFVFGFIVPPPGEVPDVEYSVHMPMNCISVSCLALLQVKKIMNSVFQSLRGEFELDEMYSGRTVLGVVMNTIKV